MSPRSTTAPRPYPRRYFRALLLAALAAGCGADPRPTGVLLISIDSLRADHLSCYGYRSETRPDVPTSPHIDRLLAAEGTRFTQAFSTTSWTLPAHMAMLTGLPNELHGVRDLPDRLHASRRLLQEELSDAGWRTFGIWSGPNLHPWFGFDRGFDEYVDCSAHVVPDPEIFALHDAADPERVEHLHDESHAGVTGPAIVAAFERWWRGVGEDQRFFAFVHLWDVHYDYTPPREHDVFYPSYTGKVDGRDFRNLMLAPATAVDDLRRIISLYDGELRFTDENVGALLVLLRESGRLDDTLVVLTADHGEEFMEHGCLGHKNGLYDEAVRVPLIVRWPAAIPAGREVHDLVSLVDLAPTILDYCGIPGLDAAWGRSLRGALGHELATRPVPLELTYRPKDVDVRGMRTEEFKVLRYQKGGAGHLLDLLSDPHEARLLKARELPADDTRIDHARRFWSELDRRGVGLETSPTEALPPELETQLGDLGYLDTADEPAEPAPAEGAPAPGNDPR